MTLANLFVLPLTNEDYGTAWADLGLGWWANVFHIGVLIKKYYSIIPFEFKYGRIIGQLQES